MVEFSVIKFLPFRQKITNNTCCCIDSSKMDLPMTANSESSNSIHFSQQKNPPVFRHLLLTADERWHLQEFRPWYGMHSHQPSCLIYIEKQMSLKWSWDYQHSVYLPSLLRTTSQHWIWLLLPNRLTYVLGICFKVLKCLDTPTGTKELKSFVQFLLGKLWEIHWEVRCIKMQGNLNYFLKNPISFTRPQCFTSFSQMLSGLGSFTT